MNYRFDNFEIDTALFKVTKDGVALSIEPKVFDLIVYLIENRYEVVSRDQLFAQVWKGREVSDTSLSNHIKLARKTFGDNGELQKVISTVRGRGYQFIGQIEETNPENVYQAGNTKSSNGISLLHSNKTAASEVTATSPTTFQKRTYQLTVALLLGIIVTLLFFQFYQTPKQTAQIKRIAVLPFTNLKPEPQTDYLGFAIADQIIGDLAKLNNITVRASGAVRQYQKTNIELSEIAAKLDVEYLLTGSYLQENDSIRMSSELIEVNNNKMIWRESSDDKFSNTYVLQDQLARQVAQKLEVKLTQIELAKLDDEVPYNPLAYEYYLRAVSYPRTVKGAELAINMLKKALTIDNDYSPIYTELGTRTGHLVLVDLQSKAMVNQAIGYYQQAILINKKSRSAIAGLAKLYTETGRISDAIELVRELLALNPNDAEAHHSLGYIYRYAGMENESIQAFNTAISIDSRSEWFHNLATSYYAAGQFKKALKAFEKAGRTPISLGWRATIYYHLGESDKSLALIEEVLAMNPGDFWVLDSLGLKAIIENRLEDGLGIAKQLEDAQVFDGEVLFYWAGLHAELGNQEGALRMLNLSLEAGYFNYPHIKREKLFDSLRNEPEFNRLMNRFKMSHFQFRAKYMNF